MDEQWNGLWNGWNEISDSAYIIIHDLYCTAYAYFAFASWWFSRKLPFSLVLWLVDDAGSHGRNVFQTNHDQLPASSASLVTPEKLHG